MQKFLAHPLVLVSITCVAVLLFFSLEQSGKKADTSTLAIQTEQEKKEQLAAEVSELTLELTEAESPLYQEKLIRDELLLQKDGEIVLQIPTQKAVNESIEPVIQLTPWQEWQAVFTQKYRAQTGHE